MIKLIVLGLISGLFFSTTYILNEQMSHDGGHWFWSASLRYVFMFMMLSVLIVVQQGSKTLTSLIQIFKDHMLFWCITGGIGFGLFYAGICFAGDHASGWVVASTFMFTVVASLFVLSAFGQQFDKRVIGVSLMIFIGVLLVNLNEALHSANTNASFLTTLCYGALPALVAAFCYPIGNQLVWQASHNAKNHKKNAKSHASHTNNKIQSFIPTIDTHLLDNAFNKIWLMTLGTLPFWLLLAVMTQPYPPTHAQAMNTFLVALCSGVIATSIFLYARQLADSPKAVAGVDATQASEVVFSLLGGMVLFGTALPSIIGLIGIILIVLGLVLFAKQ